MLSTTTNPLNQNTSRIACIRCHRPSPFISKICRLCYYHLASNGSSIRTVRIRQSVGNVFASFFFLLKFYISFIPFARISRFYLTAEKVCCCCCPFFWIQLPNTSPQWLMTHSFEQYSSSQSGLVMAWFVHPVRIHFCRTFDWWWYALFGAGAMPVAPNWSAPATKWCEFVCCGCEFVCGWWEFCMDCCMW